MRLAPIQPFDTPRGAAPISTPQGPHGTMLEANLAQNNAITNLGLAVAEAEKNYTDQKIKHQVQQATVSLIGQMQAFELANMGKEFYTADEVPADVTVRRTDRVVGPNSEITEVPRERIPAYEVYPQLYEKQSRALIDANSGFIERDVERNEWFGKSSNVATAKLIEVQAASFKAQHGAIRKSEVENLDIAAKSGNKSAVDAILGSTENFSDSEKRQLQQVSYHTMEIGFIQTAIAAGDVVTMEREIDRLSNPKNQSYLTGPEREAQVSELKRKSAEYITSREFAKKSEAEMAQFNLALKVDKRQASEMEIAAAVKARVITAETGMKLLHRMESLAKKDAVTKISWASLVDLQGKQPGMSVLAGNTDREKIADDAVVQLIAGKPPEQQQEVFATVIGSMGYVPKAAREQLFSANRSTNGNILYNGAMTFMSYENINPATMKDIPEADTENIRRVVASVRSGASPEEAKMYAARLARTTPAEKEAEKERGTAVGRMIEKRGATDFVKYLGEKTLSFWQSAPRATTPENRAKFGTVGADAVPGVPISLENQLEVDMKRNLTITGGNEAEARAMTYGNLEKRWRFTTVNGGRQIMENMPPVDDEKLRVFINHTYAQQPIDGEKRDVKIMSTGETSRAITAGRQIVPYLLYYVDQDTKAPIRVGTWQYNPATFGVELGKAQIATAKSKQELRDEIRALETTRTMFGTP